MTINRAAEIKLVPVDEITPHPRNPNKHSPEQIDRLAKIIEYQGFRNPLIISKQSDFIVAGHGRLMAARKLGMKEVPVTYQDFESEDQEYAAIVSDNAIADWAELDLGVINLALQDFGPFDIDLLGINDFTVDLAEKLDPQCDEDETPDAPVEPKSKLGDIYELGSHRVMCGDSTSFDAFKSLMNGDKADITFTSPPYNVGKTPNDENKYATYQDDRDTEEYKTLLHDFTVNCLLNSDYVFVNIQSLSGNKVGLIEYLYNLREKYADTIIWDKESAEPAMERKVLNSQFEYIHIFSNEAKRVVGKRDFRGTISNVFRLNSKSGKEYAKIHKATFRVELPQFFLENFTESSCLDPFGGTGTTLIACEKTGRQAYLMELDPKYVDVIVSRYVKYTGNKKIKLNGEEIEWEVSNGESRT